MGVGLNSVKVGDKALYRCTRVVLLTHLDTASHLLFSGLEKLVL
jgi:hypothetical protein